MTYYPYNETFCKYGEPAANFAEAQVACDEENEYLGGHWVVHTKAEYESTKDSLDELRRIKRAKAGRES